MTQETTAEVTKADIEGWLVGDCVRLARLEARRDAGEAVLPEEIDMVKATIAQLEAELRFMAACEERNLI